MLKKLIVFAITSGLAGKAFRALMNRQRTAPVARQAASPTASSGSMRGAQSVPSRHRG